MKLSVWPSTSQSWADLLDVVGHVDAAGWYCAYVADHFMGDGASFGAATAPWLEATATLAALAGATDQVRLAPLVLSATYRHPAVVANWAATVDHTSGGRFTLGLGAGWQVNEHEQYGLELGSPGERVGRFDEYLAVVRGLLTEERTTVAGRWFTVTDCPLRAQAGAAAAPDPGGRQGRADARRDRPAGRSVEPVELTGGDGGVGRGPGPPLRPDRARSRHRSTAPPRPW